MWITIGFIDAQILSHLIKQALALPIKFPLKVNIKTQFKFSVIFLSLHAVQKSPYDYFVYISFLSGQGLTAPTNIKVCLIFKPISFESCWYFIQIKGHGCRLPNG